MTKVLIIDDERPIRETLDMLLREKGYEVLTSESGEKGLALIQKNPLDIVILDLRLPGMNGIEVMREIRKIFPKIIIILITAYHNEDVYAEAENFGIYGYLLKPINIGELETLIESAVK
ncbi:MAG: response regulator [Desulfobacterota bacterium]|nr:response regulator [Thermodesulfobacteriota bacterium]